MKNFTSQVKELIDIVYEKENQNIKDAAELIFDSIKESKTVSLKTETYKSDIAEFTYEIASRSDAEEVLKYKETEGIINISIIDID